MKNDNEVFFDWIPAFAGMTTGEAGMTRDSGIGSSSIRHAGLDPASSGILCRPGPAPAKAGGDSLYDWIPACAGMTTQDAGMTWRFTCL